MKKMVLIIFVFCIFPSMLLAASPDHIRLLSEKLDRWDVEQAWADTKEQLIKEPKDTSLLELASHIAFHRGEYGEALTLIRSAIEAGGEEEKRKRFALFVEETIGVVAPFKKYESPHFIVSLDEKQDGLLAGYIQDALEATYQAMADHYGFMPKEKIRVEIFPNARAFYYASTLSARDIEIGAVGLAQFNKLMILSPAALVHGYRWLDSVSHEYMHYLIMKRTGNKAPIWFHEGLAKFEETRWRRGPSYLSSLYQGLLARALEDQKLIRFERMEPSLIKLETPEEIQLAYAQAASAIEFIIARAGYGGLRKIMARMADQEKAGAGESIKEVLGVTFEEFESGWKAFLASKELKEVGAVKIQRYKIKEGKADEERIDMEEIKSLVARNRAHLADLLKERGRIQAAIMEYNRALTETPDSVSVLNRLASALIGLNREEEALPFLKKAETLSPDHPVAYAYLGQAYLKLKDFNRAKGAFQESIQINPFNSKVHEGLLQVYEILGEAAPALREKEVVNLLHH